MRTFAIGMIVCRACMRGLKPAVASLASFSLLTAFGAHAPSTAPADTVIAQDCPPD